MQVHSGPSYILNRCTVADRRSVACFASLKILCICYSLLARVVAVAVKAFFRSDTVPIHNLFGHKFKQKLTETRKKGNDQLGNHGKKAEEVKICGE